MSTQVRLSSQIKPESVTFTTTGNIDDLDFGNAALIRMNNASLATIRGLKAGQDGQEVTIVSVGAGEVDLAHQNTNSTAANRLINMATSASTPLGAGIGAAVYQYDGTASRWRLVEHNSGWIAVAYNSANFLADVGTWTVDLGDQTTFSYVLIGNTMTVSLTIVTSTLSSTPSVLTVPIPGGFLSALEGRQVTVVQNSSNTNGMVRSTPGGTTLSLYKDASGNNYIAQTNAFQVFATLTFQVT